MATKKAKKASKPHYVTRKRKHSASTSKAPSTKDLPIGMAYFNSEKNKGAFAPITYAPLPYQSYAAHSLDTYEDDDDDDEAESRRFQVMAKRSFKGEPDKDELTTMQSVQYPQHSAPNMISDSSVKNESNSYAPEMVRFTLDDAVMRPRANRTHKSGAPRTMQSLYVEQSSNIAYSTEPPGMVQFIATTPVPTGQANEQRFVFRPAAEQQAPVVIGYKRLPPHRHRNAVATPPQYLSRQFRQSEQQLADVTTSPVPTTDQNPNMELQIKAGLEKWTLSPMSRNEHRRRRLPHRLEVSPSYTRQRVQGHGDEAFSTTPMPFPAEKLRQTHEEAAIVTAVPPRTAKRTLEGQTQYFQ